MLNEKGDAKILKSNLPNLDEKPRVSQAYEMIETVYCKICTGEVSRNDSKTLLEAMAMLRLEYPEIK